jgi:iron-sulfur cluster repair protein YtfE (RIC family)
MITKRGGFFSLAASSSTSGLKSRWKKRTLLPACSTIQAIYAEFHERVREPVGSLAELAVRQPHVAVDDADLLPEERLRPIAELQDGQRNEHH